MNGCRDGLQSARSGQFIKKRKREACNLSTMLNKHVRLLHASALLHFSGCFNHLLLLINMASAEGCTGRIIKASKQSWDSPPVILSNRVMVVATVASNAQKMFYTEEAIVPRGRHQGHSEGHGRPS